MNYCTLKTAFKTYPTCGGKIPVDGCILEGKPVTPDMLGSCTECSLYLNTCMPCISNGVLVGAECDYDYCCVCQYYEECGK